MKIKKHIFKKNENTKINESILKSKAKIKAVCLVSIICISLTTGCRKNESGINIGVNLELTGNLAQYGDASLKGIELATEQINGQGGINGEKINLKVLDNRSAGSEAGLSAQRLQYYDDVVAMIGPSMSGGVKSVLGSEVNIPMITPTATADDIRASGNDNVYRMCFTDTQQGEAMGEYASLLGFKKVAFLLNVSSDYSVNSGENFAKTFEASGGEIVMTEYYKDGDIDFNAVLTKIKKENVDAIYFPGFYLEGGLAIKQARQLGMDVAFLSGDAFDAEELEFIAGGKNNLTNIYFTNHYYPDDNRMIEFSEIYKERYGETPSAYSSLAYDSAMVLYEAISNCSGDLSVLRNELDEIENYQGVTGMFSMGENRDVEKDVKLNKIQNGNRSGALKGSD